MQLLNKYNIGKRFYLVFGLVLSLTFINLIYNIFNLEVSKKSAAKINSSLLSIDYLIEADRDAYQSKVAISEALHAESFNNAETLTELIKEIDENKNQVKERYSKFSTLLNVKEDEELLKIEETFKSNYEQLSLITDSISGCLKAGNDSVAADLYFSRYNNYFKPLRTSLNDFTELHLKQSDAAYTKILELNSAVKRDSIIIFIIIFILFLSSGYALTNSILKPLKELQQIVSEISLGKLQDIKISGNDEIAQMGGYISKLSEGLKKTASYAQDIGKGNLQTEFVPLSEHDVLGLSLIQMKNNLAKFAKEDEQRSWSSNGIASLSEILRKTNLDSEALYFNTLLFVIKYLKANQGGLFVINNENPQEPFIELVASYAYERKKFINKRIEMGEGLLGQAVLEKDIIYLTEVPDNYVTITSGTGEARPNNILIVPLKNNEEVFGVIEIAAFHLLKDFEIDFVRKISEGIASTISSVRVNEKTQRLLGQSQQMTEELRAQEEEMRQNLEELHSTQEEMSRKQVETDAQFEAINRTSAYIEFDYNGNVIVANELFLSTLHYSLSEIRGKHHRMFVDSEYATSAAYEEFWSDLRNGKAHTGEFRRLNKEGKEVWLIASYTPVYDATNKVIKVLKLASDITTQKLKTEELLNQFDALQKELQNKSEKEQSLISEITELRRKNK